MSDRMRPIPFGQLLKWMMTEYEQERTLFGVPVKPLAQASSASSRQPVERCPEIPLGTAAGPHNQLAQNIIAAYAAGARYFELKTVQTLAGGDLKVAKPCILIADEGYNVEWSTELSVADACGEYIKAWLLLHVLAAGFAIGSPLGFVFNMSVGYDFAGIRSDSVNTFIDTLINASDSAVWDSCRQYLLDYQPAFKNISPETIRRISPRICQSITLSTMHGCPAGEIEKIASYLLTEKKLDTFVKCNPTLLGFPFVREILDQQGFKTIAFDDHHFREDLQMADAIPMLRRLMNLAREHGLTFGVKLTNTLPVQILNQELPGDEMYLSGPALYPLAINLAAQLADTFDGKLPISYCGGADYFNTANILRTGIRPVTLTTTLLKPGGYGRLSQIADLLAEQQDVHELAGIDVPALRQLASEALRDPEYRAKRRPFASRKVNRKLPLTDCFLAPCKEGCPFGQDIPEYIHLNGEGRYLDALLTITARNPLTNLTSLFCDRQCMRKCTRLDYEEPVDIRGAKQVAVRQAFETLVNTLEKPVFDQTVSVACIGGTPAGLAAAWFLCRQGIQTTVFERKDAIGSLGGPMSPAYRQAAEKDLKLLQAAGVQLMTDYEDPVTAEKLLDSGFQYVFNAREALGDKASIAAGIAAGIRFAETTIKAITGHALAFGPIIQPDRQRLLASAIENRTILRKAASPENEHRRCLACNLLCNICADVCPNRANVTITTKPGIFTNQNQLIHLDGSCNECGNCAAFCPYDGAPYRDKLTLFWQEQDFAESQNDGFVLINEADRHFRIRLNGRINELQLGSPGSDDVPQPILALIKEIIEKHAYLLR